MENYKTIFSGNGKLDFSQFSNKSRQAHSIYFINILKIFLGVFFITFNMVYLSDVQEMNYKIVRLTLSIPVALTCIILLRLKKLKAAALVTCTLSFIILFYFPVFFPLNIMELYISNSFLTLAACLIPCFVFDIREELRWILILVVSVLLLSLTSDNLMIYRFGRPEDSFYQFYKEKVLFLTIVKTGIVFTLSAISLYVLTLNQKHESVIQDIQEKLKNNNINLEKLVHERTQILEEKNKRLLEYTYINSHLLRGPVARLKGLMQLIELDKSDSNVQFCHNNFNLCLGELDSVIEMINKILNEEDQKEVEAIQEKVKKMYSGIYPLHPPSKN